MSYEKYGEIIPVTHCCICNVTLKRTVKKLEPEYSGQEVILNSKLNDKYVLCLDTGEEFCMTCWNNIKGEI